MERTHSLATAARRRGQQWISCPAVQQRWLSSSTAVAAAASASSSPPLLLYSLSLHRYPPAVQTSSHAAATASHRQRRLARLEPPAIIANRPQIAVGSVLLDARRREAEDARIQQKPQPQSSRSPTQFQSAASAQSKTADAAAIDAISDYHTHMLLKIVRYRRTDSESPATANSTGSACAPADSAWIPAGTAGDYDVSVATRVLSAADSLNTLSSTVSSLLSSSSGSPRSSVESVCAVSPFSRFMNRLRGRPPRDTAFTQTLDSARSIASLFVTPLPLKRAASTASPAESEPPGPIALRLRQEDAAGSISESSLPQSLLINHDGLVHSGALPRHLLVSRLRLGIVMFLCSVLLLGVGNALAERHLHDAQTEADRRTRLERQHALTEMAAQKRREDKRAVVARGGAEMEEMRHKKEELRAKMEEAERLRVAKEAEQRRKAEAAAAADKR